MIQHIYTKTDVNRQTDKNTYTQCNQNKKFNPFNEFIFKEKFIDIETKKTVYAMILFFINIISHRKSNMQPYKIGSFQHQRQRIFLVK